MLLLQICWKWSNSAGILGQVTARGQLSLSQAIYGLITQQKGLEEVSL